MAARLHANASDLARDRRLCDRRTIGTDDASSSVSRKCFATTFVDMRNGSAVVRALVEGARKKDPYGGHQIANARRRCGGG
jgi:hypothetical protein